MRAKTIRDDRVFISERPDPVFENGYPYGRFAPDGFCGDETPVIAGDRRIRILLIPGHIPRTTLFVFNVPVGEAKATPLCGLHGGVGLGTLTDDVPEERCLPAGNHDAHLAAMLKGRRLRSTPPAGRTRPRRSCSKGSARSARITPRFTTPRPGAA